MSTTVLAYVLDFMGFITFADCDSARQRATRHIRFDSFPPKRRRVFCPPASSRHAFRQGLTSRHRAYGLARTSSSSRKPCPIPIMLRPLDISVATTA